MLDAVHSQIDTAFVRHLQKLSLKTELQQYILTRKSPADSIAWLQVRQYLAFPDDSQLLKAARQCGGLCLADSSTMNSISLRMLRAENQIRQTWFDTVCAGPCAGVLSQVNQYAEHCLEYSPQLLPEELRQSFEQLQKVHRKKPALAAVFSALLPGSGKFYAGKKHTAASSFVSCALYAAQWAESSAKLGYNHAFSWVNAGFFTVFYLTNIYASHHAVLQLRGEYKKQFLHEAARYYH